MKLLKYNSKDWQDLSKTKQEEILIKNYNLSEFFFNDENHFRLLSYDFKKLEEGLFSVEIDYCIYVENISKWTISKIVRDVYVNDEDKIKDKKQSLYRRDIIESIIGNIFTIL